MRIDDVLLAKLAVAVEKFGGAREFSQRSGINAANISRYLSGKISSVSDRNWEKLAPWLEESWPGQENFSETEVVRASAELSEFLRTRMKFCGINDVETLRRRINHSCYELLRLQICGKLNWFSHTLATVLDALDITTEQTPLSPAERRIVDNARMKRGGAGIMRLLPVISGCSCGDAPGYVAGLTSATVPPVPVPLDDERDLRAFQLCGKMMEPGLSDRDIVVVEAVEDIFVLAEGVLVVMRYTEGSSGSTLLRCGRFHRIGSDSILLSCDAPAGKPVCIALDAISWCAVIRQRISNFS